jgi:hypothetical protein
VRGAAPGVVQASLRQAKFTIYGVPNFEGVAVFLAVILPPADRAQSHGLWCFECSVAATRASKTNRCRSHAQMDGFSGDWFTRSLFPMFSGSMGEHTLS